MADVSVNISISALSYQSWLRTSYIGIALKDADGKPLLMNTELGPDQEDAFLNFLDEASREILKLFVTRQGDVEGTPFEHTSENIIYRFLENPDSLVQADALKAVLNEDVKNALYTEVTIKWFSMKVNENQLALLVKEKAKLAAHIMGNLYRLHD